MKHNLIDVKKALKFRLKTRRAKRYLKWLDARKKKGLHKCHILDQKLNDRLIAIKDFDEHINKEHFRGESDFIDDLIQALELNFDYQEYLEEEIEKFKRACRKGA